MARICSWSNSLKGKANCKISFLLSFWSEWRYSLQKLYRKQIIFERDETGITKNGLFMSWIRDKSLYLRSRRKPPLRPFFLIISEALCYLVSWKRRKLSIEIREWHSHSSTLAWKTPWTEEPGGLQSMWSLRVRHDWATSLYFSISCIGEGNGNPLQCSCLENPRDGRAWWAAVYGVAQSWTRLKWLSSSSSIDFCYDVVFVFCFEFLAVRHVGS